MKSAGWFIACVAVLVGGLFAQEKPALDLLFSVSQSVSKNEAGELGLINGGILVKDGRPEACFDLVRARGKEPELVYLILFDSGKLPQKIDLSMNCASQSQFSRGKYSLRIAEKALDVTYNYEINTESGQFLKRTIKLADRDWKADGPRVFLADSSGDKLVLKPVEVKLPATIPSPSGDDVKGSMRQVIAAISKESKEVRDFLDGEK